MEVLTRYHSCENACPSFPNRVQLFGGKLASYVTCAKKRTISVCADRFAYITVMFEEQSRSQALTENT